MGFQPLKSIHYQFYLLQLENYRIGRYFRIVWKRFLFWDTSIERQKFIWTSKMKVVAVLAFLIHLVLAVAIADLLGMFFLFIPAFFLFSFFYFIFLIIAVFLISPVDSFLKRRIVYAAKKEITSFKNLKVIGITGSYGKTTMKEVLATILREKFRMAKTPENINTPVGIARYILRDLDREAEIFVVEMGAYGRGDIRTLCDIVRPDIGILTGINESHLERFGSIENTIATKFEIIECTKRDGTILLNMDNRIVREEYERFVDGRKIFFYGFHEHFPYGLRVHDTRFFEDGSGISFALSSGEKTVYTFNKVPFLGEYIIGVIVGAIIIAQNLGMSHEDITRGIAMLRPLNHRLEPLTIRGKVLVIDDSYNGNPEGALEAIKVLRRFRERRKIYLTPGLVEIAEKSAEIHRHLGELLSDGADMVLLIKNSVTVFIGEGLEKSGFNRENIRWFNRREEAYSALPGILKEGDVILFQNDWPDNYF